MFLATVIFSCGNNEEVKPYNTIVTLNFPSSHEGQAPEGGTPYWEIPAVPAQASSIMIGTDFTEETANLASVVVTVEIKKTLNWEQYGDPINKLWELNGPDWKLEVETPSEGKWRIKALYADPENYDYFTPKYLESNGLESYNRYRRIFSSEEVEFEDLKTKIDLNMSYTGFQNEAQN